MAAPIETGVVLQEGKAARLSAREPTAVERAEAKLLVARARNAGDYRRMSEDLLACALAVIDAGVSDLNARGVAAAFLKRAVNAEAFNKQQLARAIAFVHASRAAETEAQKQTEAAALARLEGGIHLRSAAKVRRTPRPVHPLTPTHP